MIGLSRQVRQTTEAAPGAALRIMVVDDSAGQRLMLSRLLGRWGYAVTEARDGHEALALLTDHPQDIILSDWMMPGIDGLEFCRRFRDASGHGFGYFILLTSRSEKEEVAQGLDAGADDFLTKPVNTSELRARINAGGRIVEMQRALMEQTEVITATLAELQEAHAAIERDLRQARKIQQALVPERHRDFGAASVSLLCKPCGHVGGDLVGMFSPGRDRIAFYALDVSGHGITSAMVTARVASYLNPVFADDNIALERKSERSDAMRQPDEVVWHLNQRLVADPGVDEYLTMVYATIDLAAAEIRFVQAGHPPPLLIPAAAPPCFVGTAGLPVGLIGEVRHETTALRLSPGDRLLLYSDGFTEAMTRTGDMLGEEGLMRLVSECGDARGTEFLDDLFWRLTQEMPVQSRLDDDVSAALLEYGPPAR
ncbi:chemotaxis protein CheY [Roseivivax halodurans JCM 10272]|uniref:Chemotaxis protein CheY n=1 Tax=Roseivivax halodurans JCM 10272 TaxID=1449350 RepID=X7EIQ1_9RHOB|nr:fused response regulator/phosphatase [Roseivivax halodurans]ETX15023.1 chemotaxis protein CheY [Roseivivax halodurans JCM 10272]